VLSFLAFAGWFHLGEPLFCGEYDKVLLKKNEHSFLFVVLPSDNFNNGAASKKY
jgi:hypothetical protein